MRLQFGGRAGATARPVPGLPLFDLPSVADVRGAPGEGCRLSREERLASCRPMRYIPGFVFPSEPADWAGAPAGAVCLRRGFSMDFFPKNNADGMADPVELHRAAMCPVHDVRLGAQWVVFARRTAPGAVAFAWFRLAPDGCGVEACDLALDATPETYRRFLDTVDPGRTLAAVRPGRAKTRLMHAVWRGEAGDRLPPPNFAGVVALLDGVQVESACD